MGEAGGAWLHLPANHFQIPPWRREKWTPRRRQVWSMRTLTEAASGIQCSGISAQLEGTQRGGALGGAAGGRRR